MRAKDVEAELVNEIAKYKHDLFGCAQFLWPWGVPSGPLAAFAGPQAWQAEQLVDFSLSLGSGTGKGQHAIASGKGIGKLLGVSLKIRTPTGERRWGDLRAGDWVFAESGLPTRVLQTHWHGVKPMFRMVFDDCSETLCGSEHLWKVMGRKERRNDKGAIQIDNWVVLSTQALLDKGLRYGGKLNARQFEIPVQGAVVLPPANLPLDPYLMGVWLGDGARGTSRYSKPYPEVAAEITRRGYTVRERGVDQRNIVGINPIVRSTPVMQLYSHQRYVPENYKHAAIAQRRDLLCGLLDSDGECAKHGSVIFNSTSKKLVEDVIWLARSLGGKAQMHPIVKAGRYKDANGDVVECRDCYRATLALPFNPFRIAHKAAPWHKPEPRYFKRWIDHIEPAGDEEAMCISIEDPSHCYQANDFIVTHNSALLAMTAITSLVTAPDTRVRLTAGTEPQLRTTTMPEISKWFQTCLVKHWFKNPATSIYAADPEHEKTWRLDAIPWNAQAPEAFAGLHNYGKRIVVLMDEASQIDDAIFGTTDGIMTDKDTEVLWAAFANPTRGDGRFYRCFGDMRHRWKCKQIDSRNVSISDKEEIAKWVADYGEDSDYVRVMVRGMFPRVSSMQFIGAELVRAARKRDAYVPLNEALVMGIDVARFGDDQTVFAFRKGRDARAIPWVKLRSRDTMEIAAAAAGFIEKYHVDAVHVDGGGVGAGVVDRLRQMGHRVVDVQFGARADRLSIDTDAARYANKRSEMWGYMKAWLEYGGVPDDQELENDCTGVLYGYRDGTKGSEIILEAKEHMKKRGQSSPDSGDALALTFAYPALPRILAGGPAAIGRQLYQAQTEYNPHQSQEVEAPRLY